MPLPLEEYEVLKKFVQKKKKVTPLTLEEKRFIQEARREAEKKKRQEEQEEQKERERKEEQRDRLERYRPTPSKPVKHYRGVTIARIHTKQGVQYEVGGRIGGGLHPTAEKAMGAISKAREQEYKDVGRRAPWLEKKEGEEQWKQQIREQYPASEYDIQFMNGEAQISLLPEIAQARWRKKLLTQYPASRYHIVWKNGEALIYERFGLRQQTVTPKFMPRESPDVLKMLFLGGPWIIEPWSPRSHMRMPSTRHQPREFPTQQMSLSLARQYMERRKKEELFPWFEEHLTPKEFEQKYGPFVGSLGLPTGARITHVRRTEKGYEMKYMEPSPYDVVKPWGVTIEDVEALEKQGKSFTAYLAKHFMAGGLWHKGEYTLEEFKEKYGVTFDLPEDMLITSWRRGPEGYEVKYMPQKDWMSLPSYVKEGREPTFWEVPLYTHLVKGWSGVLGEVEKKRKQIYGPTYIAFEKTTTRGMMRESEKELSFIPAYSVKDIESFVGSVEYALGRPSHRSYIPAAGGAAISTFLTRRPFGSRELIMSEMVFGPQRRAMLGKGPRGALTTEYLEAEMESIKEHPIAGLVGEIGFDIALAVATGKAIGKVGKWAGGTRVGKAVSSTRVAKAFKRLTSKPRVERLSELGEIQVQKVGPYEYTLQRITGMKTVTSKISWKEARFIEDLLKHTSIKQLEAGGVQFVKISTPKMTWLGRTSSMFLRPAQPFMEALKAGEKVVLGSYRVGPVIKSPITATALRHYTAVAWWGTIEKGYLTKLLQYATATKFLGGVVTKTVGVTAKQTLWKLPAYIGVSAPSVLPSISRGFFTLATVTGMKTWVQPTTPKRWQTMFKRKKTKFATLTLPQLEKKQRSFLAPTLKLKQTLKQTLYQPQLPAFQRTMQRLKTKRITLPHVGFIKPIYKQRFAPILPSMQLGAVAVSQRGKQVLAPQQMQMQIQRQQKLDKPFPPDIIPVPPPPPTFMPPRLGYDSSKAARGLRGMWFKRTHPIKAAREMWETFSGKKKRKKKAKSKKKRKRKKH